MAECLIGPLRSGFSETFAVSFGASILNAGALLSAEMFLLVSSALTLALIESSHPGSSQVAAGIPDGDVNQSPSSSGMSANNMTVGNGGSFLWGTFGGGGNGGSGGNLISESAADYLYLQDSAFMT